MTDSVTHTPTQAPPSLAPPARGRPRLLDAVLVTLDDLLAMPRPSTTPTISSCSQPQLLTHVKLLICHHASAVVALDTGLLGEAVRHFSKVLV